MSEIIAPTIPERATWLARGRVAGVALLVVLVFTLFVYHYLQQGASFNSDHLYCVHFGDDLLHGRDVRGWHLPAAPYAFPDVALVVVCLALTSNVTAVFVLYAAFYYGLLLAVLFALNREIGFPRRQSFTIAGLSVALLLASHFHPDYVIHSLMMTHPGNHMGCLLVGLGVTAFVLRSLRRGYGWLAAGLFVAVGAASAFSDQLLIVQCFVPLCAAVLVLTAFRRIAWRRALVTVALLGLSTFLAIKGRNLFVWLGLVPMRITHLDEGLLANVSGTLSDFVASWWLLAEKQPLMVAVLAIHLAAAPTVLVMWAWRGRRGETAPVAPGPLNAPAVLLVAIVFLLAPLANVGALLVTGTSTPALVHRYLHTWWMLPFLSLLLWPRLLPGRFLRLAPMAVVAFIAFRIAVFPDPLSPDRFTHRYTPLARALDDMVAKHGPMRGFAEYWRARENRYLTRQRVPVSPILSWGMPWLHGFNPNSYLSDDPHDLTVPNYHFVVFALDDQPGPDRRHIETRYGKPDEIIRGPDFEIWRYERMASRRLELFLRAQLAQRLVRHRPFVGPTEPAALARPRANLSPWTARGNILFPRSQTVTVRFARPATGAMIDIGALFTDEYVLTFLRDGEELGTTRVPAVDWNGSERAYCPPGMQSRLVPVPAACRPDGFDEVRVAPAGVQDWYVLGHFLVFDEWIPYKPAARRHDERQHRYEGEDLHGPDSQEVTTIADPSASAGRARQASASFQGYMAYGPYLPLPPGRYRVAFALRAEDNQSADTIATIDCIASGGGLTLNNRSLPGTDFAPAGQYRRFDLTFESEEELDLVEFRVNVPGKTAVTLDYVEVTRLEEESAAASARR